ncbi:hypothetical protein [uncultured Devosia sp.]|uniref:hypothetical protein n=1 Tax=uncultured Devosia sp. TaxID=211434 RepID=UPI0035CB0891
MKFPVRTTIGLATLLIAGGTIYGWGIGLFYPCGPLDGVLKLSRCTVVARYEATRIEAMLAGPEGHVLSVLRGDGPEPGVRQLLVQTDLADGSTGNTVELVDIPNAASWMSAALSPDGTLLAASLFDGRPIVIDRASGRTRVTIEPFYNVAMVGFLDDTRVMIDRGNTSSGRPPAMAAMVYSATDGTRLADISGSPTLPLYRQGLANAVSPDGKVLVQHEETLADSGVIALRIADSAFADWANPLAVAPLGAWGLSEHIWPEVWISPEGAYVAASFDGARSWGEDTSALLIWEVASRKLVQRIPTNQASWDLLVWLPDRRVAAARFNLDSRRSEIAVIDY